VISLLSLVRRGRYRPSGWWRQRLVRWPWRSAPRLPLTGAASGGARSISRRAKYQSKRRRAMILLASSTGMSAPEIARLVRTDESHVRKVIHAFNEEGFPSLDPDYRGGRPRKTTPAERDRIVAVARTRPDHQGVPLTRWSLPKLADHLATMGVMSPPRRCARSCTAPASPTSALAPGSGARTPTSPPRPSGSCRSTGSDPPTARWSASTRWGRSS
jgi:transposase